MPANDTQEVLRLTKVAYDQLERQVPSIYVGDKTTELQAAFQLGVQMVLRLLREGFVIGA